MQIDALESKVASLGQLLDSEKAAAESALRASEQAWQTQLAEAVAGAASDAKAAAEEEASTVQSALQQQLNDVTAAREVLQAYNATSPLLWPSDQAGWLADGCHTTSST